MRQGDEREGCCEGRPCAGWSICGRGHAYPRHISRKKPYRRFGSIQRHPIGSAVVSQARWANLSRLLPIHTQVRWIVPHTSLVAWTPIGPGSNILRDANSMTREWKCERFLKWNRTIQISMMSRHLRLNSPPAAPGISICRSESQASADRAAPWCSSPS